ncbi:hypothetical protein BW721_09455 [Jeotgalibaca sp. PTS2502]|uniref:YcxB family protein n=1 Tax=Jeotgalibaca sp. PTS2502 TaxID=1903686 RepID=UPI000973CD6E|nr:YcxB family protein [Jeotgalibaca sp. PTS2502]APZ49839.1 hypothetical protein BW721_09455 [Jeotgalibaca sp. PTS2502]
MTYKGKGTLSLKDSLFLNLTLSTNKYLIYASFTMFLCFIIFMLFMGDYTVSRQIGLSILIFLFIFSSFILNEAISLIKSVKKFPESIGHRVFIIDNEGLHITQPSNDETKFFSWNEVESLINRKNFWLLRLNNQQIKAIPHAAFKESEIQEINHFLVNKLESKTRF